MANEISPSNALTTMQFNAQSGILYKKHAYHPYRYFIAAGETLQTIKDMLDDAANVPAELAKIAAEVGAKSVQYNRFAFDDDETIDIPAPGQLVYKQHGLFVSDIASPSEFYPDVTHYGASYIYLQLAHLATLSGDAAEREKKEICRQHGADDIRNGRFIFRDAEDNTKLAKPRTLQQLKSNTLFIGAPDASNFIPDPRTPQGLDLAQRVNFWEQAQKPEERFINWLGCKDVKTDPHGHPRFKDSPSRPNDPKSARVERIDDQWIVAVPVVGMGRYGADGKGGVISGYQEEIVVPPGSVPLAISDYFRMLEDNGMLSFTSPTNAPQP